MGNDAASIERAQVTDWLHDWDWLDDQWGPNAIEIWNDIREECPMATCFATGSTETSN